MKDEDTKNLPVTTDGYDSDDGDLSLIKGEIAKCVDGIWSVKNGAAFPPKTQLLALATATALQHWHGGLPVDTIPKVADKPFPDVNKLNEAIPQKKVGKRHRRPATSAVGQGRNRLSARPEDGVAVYRTSTAPSAPASPCVNCATKSK